MMIATTFILFLHSATTVVDIAECHLLTFSSSSLEDEDDFLRFLFFDFLDIFLSRTF